MAPAAGRVKLREAIDPLVLAVDIGSTASRGDVYDAAGRPVQGGREKVPHQFTTRDDGTSEIDPDQIVGEVQQIITALATDRRAGRRLPVRSDNLSPIELPRTELASRTTKPCTRRRSGRPTRTPRQSRALLVLLACRCGRPLLACNLRRGTELHGSCPTGHRFAGR
jgi:gluconokinase